MNQSVTLSDVFEVLKTSLNLTHLDFSKINESTPLVGTGLGLDSVDILELVVAIEKKYGLRIDSAERGRETFQTVGSLLKALNSKK